ncbi:MAG: amidohydrolase [Sphingomonas bacterium]|uniref:N-acyl-D-amino-acid deacylase family protein n=1 Tax=Sphingomonas bacterium TaxID=1895847 RepID=UPI002612E0C8|nr:amidohydrolase family protein [Sphingomonas bacterium]MDB5705288.1 amidohydrolase [Sphingomonas bacterium]
MICRSKFVRLPLLTLSVSLLAAPIVARTVRQTSDLVITGGTIYDGSSIDPIVGDIAIAGDRIVYVGPTAKNPYTGKRTVSAKGMVVAPGFIDPHTHADAFVMGKTPGERLTLAWMMQGATTIFLGVDGFGQPGHKVEVDAFFRQVAAQTPGVNVATYVGFGAVRTAVIGDDDRAPTNAELATMKGLVAKGMCEGALGLSAGLFYAPQSFARTDEVIAVAKEAAVRGGVYDTHQRDESSYTIGVMNSTREAISIGRGAGMPVHFAHLKALGVDVQGKAPELVSIIEAARAEGIDVTADQYPWEASGSGLEPALLPRWAVDGGRPAMLKRFADPVQLARIKGEMVENMRRRGGAASLLLTSLAHPWTGKRLNEIAAEWGIDPVDAALRIITESADGSAVVSFNMAENDIKLLMRQPWIVTGSDGSAGHPRMYATFPQKYAKYVLKEHAISLADFINSSTGRTADMFKLDHRGHLRTGYFADIVVFDPAAYRPRADYIHPTELTVGVRTLIVNGAVAIDQGKPTGVAAGRGLRHNPPAGSCPA